MPPRAYFYYGRVYCRGMDLADGTEDWECARCGKTHSSNPGECEACGHPRLQRAHSGGSGAGGRYRSAYWWVTGLLVLAFLAYVLYVATAP